MYCFINSARKANTVLCYYIFAALVLITVLQCDADGVDLWSVLRPVSFKLLEMPDSVWH